MARRNAVAHLGRRSVSLRDIPRYRCFALPVIRLESKHSGHEFVLALWVVEIEPGVGSYFGAEGEAAWGYIFGGVVVDCGGYYPFILERWLVLLYKRYTC